MSMSTIPAFYTSAGPSSNNGGLSGVAFGSPGINGFGFPSFGDPAFYFTPAASSFFLNDLLGFANGSAVNINFGQPPAQLGLGELLTGNRFFPDPNPLNAINPNGNPYATSIFNQYSPGYGTSYAGGGYGSSPGYGGYFFSGPQAQSSPFGSGGLLGWNPFTGSGTNPFSGFSPFYS